MINGYLNKVCDYDKWHPHKPRRDYIDAASGITPWVSEDG